MKLHDINEYFDTSRIRTYAWTDHASRFRTFNVRPAFWLAGYFTNYWVSFFSEHAIFITFIAFFSILLDEFNTHTWAIARSLGWQHYALFRNQQKKVKPNKKNTAKWCETFAITLVERRANHHSVKYCNKTHGEQCAERGTNNNNNNDDTRQRPNNINFAIEWVSERASECVWN